MKNGYLIDSNILLRISRRDDLHHKVAARALERLLSADSVLYYTPQNIAEFWNVWTRSVQANGFGLPSETAEQEIAKFEGMMVLAADHGVYQHWRRLVRDYRVAGVQVHDARLVASMLSHGISRVLTLNVADFARYAGEISAVHPESV